MMKFILWAIFTEIVSHVVMIKKIVIIEKNIIIEEIVIIEKDHDYWKRLW